MPGITSWSITAKIVPARLRSVMASTPIEKKEQAMYVVVQHTFVSPSEAFARGEKLIKNEGAPDGTTVLQFYPARVPVVVHPRRRRPAVLPRHTR